MWGGYEQIVSSYLEPDQIAYLSEDGITPIATSLNLCLIRHYLDYIVQFTPNTLVELNISRTKVSSSELHAILTVHTQLHTLDISYTHVKSISSFTSYLTHLTSLNMRGNQTSGHGLSELTTLTSLNVYHTELTLACLNEVMILSELLILKITLPREFNSFNGSFKRLRELSLDNATDLVLSQLHQYPLEYINLTGSRISDDGVLSLRSLRHLRSVDLSQLNMTGNGFTALTNLTHLSVTISSTLKYNCLANLRHLRALKIGHTRDVDELNPSSHQHLGFLNHMRFLQYVELTNVNISNAGFEVLTTLPLQIVKLRWVELSSYAMQMISRIHTLLIVQLEFAKYDLMSLQFLRPPALMHLTLYDNKNTITDANVDVLTGLRLDTFHLYPMRCGNVDAAVLTTEGIDQLVRNGVIFDPTAVYANDDHVNLKYGNRYSMIYEDIFTYDRRWYER